MLTKLHAIWQLMEGQRLRYGAAVAALVLASCFLYLVPLVPQIVIDGVLLDSSATPSRVVTNGVALLGGAEFLKHNLWWPALVIAVITVCAGVFTYLRGRLSAMAAEEIARGLRERFYDHVQHLPCRYFDTVETGDLIQRCTSDVETIRTFLSTQIVEIGRAVLMLLIPIPLMLLIDLRMTLASLVLVPPVVIFSFAYFFRIKRVFKDKDEAEGVMTATIQQNLTGIRVVKAFNRASFETNRFEGHNRVHRELDYRLYALFADYWSVSDLLCFLQRAVVVGVGIVLVAMGELPIGAFFFFLSAVSMFIWPVRMMGRILSELGKSLVALERIEEILHEERESCAATDLRPELEGEITFEHVTFHHGAGQAVLEDVSFSVTPGETLAIIGPSGSGKSTIVNLLLRFYDYESGSIRLDGHELTTLARDHVRASMAVVMQEPFLYSRSLGDNITIGRADAHNEEMVEAATVASIHESIERFEDGYQTLVGERGVTLSGGQRQRVALARALLQRPAVLVLDDALSAVDTETEAAIIEALQSRHGQQTTLIIAHRISTLMHADRILVLEDGRIAQQGTHDELRSTDGLYRRLLEIQASGVDELVGATGGTDHG